MKNRHKLIEAYEYVIRLDPPELNYFKIYVSFIEVLIEAEQYQKGKNVIQRVMKKYDDNNLDLIRAYVRVCSKLEQFEEGLQLIQNYEIKNKN